MVREGAVPAETVIDPERIEVDEFCAALTVSVLPLFVIVSHEADVVASQLGAVVVMVDVLLVVSVGPKVIAEALTVRVCCVWPFCITLTVTSVAVPAERVIIASRGDCVAFCVKGLIFSVFPLLLIVSHDSEVL